MSACSSALSAAREPVTMPESASPVRATTFAISLARGQSWAECIEKRTRRAARWSFPIKNQQPSRSP